MSPAQRARVGTVALAALVLGAVLGAAVVPSPGRASTDRGMAGSPGAPEVPYPEPPVGAVVAAPPYPVNEIGMTFGSGSGIDGDEPGPDLVAAYGTNGAFGYVRATDRERAQGRPTRGLVTHPRDVPSGGVDIRLYAQDGVTVVGTFTVGGERTAAR